MLKFLILTFATIVMLGFSNSSSAQTMNFPDRPVTIIVTLGAGGSSDIAVRLLANELSNIWNQSVIVTNRVGGGTVIGTTAIKNARPDGYTWGQISSSFLINPSIRTNLPYDTIKDFKGLTLFVTQPNVLVAHPSFAPNTMKELVAESKKRTVTFTGGAEASSGRLYGEMISGITGIKWLHVPYAAMSPAIPDLLAGRVELGMSGWPDLSAHIKSGRLKAIALSYSRRIDEAPELPTLMETYPEMEKMPYGSSIGLVLPIGVPENIVAKISAGIKQAVASESFKKKAMDLGMFPIYLTPTETDEYIKDQVQSWTKVIRGNNIIIKQ